MRVPRFIGLTVIADCVGMFCCHRRRHARRPSSAHGRCLEQSPDCQNSKHATSNANSLRGCTVNNTQNRTVSPATALASCSDATSFTCNTTHGPGMSPYHVHIGLLQVDLATTPHFPIVHHSIRCIEHSLACYRAGRISTTMTGFIVTASPHPRTLFPPPRPPTTPACDAPRDCSTGSRTSVDGSECWVRGTTPPISREAG